MTIGDWISAATFVCMILGLAMVLGRKEETLASLLETVRAMKDAFDHLATEFNQLKNEQGRKDVLLDSALRRIEDHEARIRELENA